MTEKTATELVQQQRLNALTEAEQKSRNEIDWLMNNVPDWENPPLPIRAFILTKRGWKTREGYVYMTYGEALGAVIYCNRRGVDENSEEYWFDPATKKHNLTSEGEIAYAHHKGYNWTVPQFEHKERNWVNPKMAIAGFPMELGCFCSITLKTQFGEEKCSALVWMSEWFVQTNPNWQTRTRWMLEVRSLSNCIKRGTGAAISANLSESTLAIPEGEPVPQISAQSVAPSRPERMPYAKPNYNRPYEGQEGSNTHDADFTPVLTESIKQAQEKK